MCTYMKENNPTSAGLQLLITSHEGGTLVMICFIKSPAQSLFTPQPEHQEQKGKEVHVRQGGGGRNHCLFTT